MHACITLLESRRILVSYLHARCFTVGPIKRFYTFPYFRNVGGFQTEVRQSIKSISPHLAYGETGRDCDVACFEIDFKYLKNIYWNYVKDTLGSERLGSEGPKSLYHFGPKKILGAGKVVAGLTTYHCACVYSSLKYQLIRYIYPIYNLV